MGEEADLARELAAARATVASQAIQINRLEEEAQRRSGLSALRELMELSEIIGVTVGHAPYQALLQGIVEAARRLFDAGAASIALVDHESDELVFEASSGGGGDVVGMRFPAHQGIAGWVVMTGEALASADVGRDPRFARDFAQTTGYVPRSIMAVPLIVREEVEGVLEVLDKASAASFGLDELELLGLFARPAAIAVEQARLVAGIGALMVEELGRLAEEREEGDVAQAARRALSDESSTLEQTLELARLVRSLGRRGERARRLAIEVLASVARYAG